MFDPPVQTQGVILNSPKPLIYHVELPNGKVVIGHISKAMRHLHDELAEGMKVTLEMTPYDFEKARISGIVRD